MVFFIFKGLEILEFRPPPLLPPWPAGSSVNTYDLPLLGVWFWSVVRKPRIGWDRLPTKIECAIISLFW